MDTFGKQAGVVALLLGGLAVIAPTFLSGTTRLGGYGGTMGGYSGMGGYGGMMGGYGGMMGGYGGMMGGYGGMGGFGTGGTIVGIVGQLGFLLVLVGGGYLLYRALADGGNANYLGSSDSGMEELRRAYARGEISDDEFETRRSRLRGGER